MQHTAAHKALSWVVREDSPWSTHPIEFPGAHLEEAGIVQRNEPLSCCLIPFAALPPCLLTEQCTTGFGPLLLSTVSHNPIQRGMVNVTSKT